MDAGEVNLLDRAVYKVTREIFTDEKGKIRDLKTVKKCIKNHPGDSTSVLQLESRLGAGAVYRLILRLLSSQVYKSNWIAAKRFPDLCEPFISHAEAGALLEEEMTTAEQATPSAIVQAHGNNNQGSSDSTEATASRTVSAINFADCLC